MRTGPGFLILAVSFGCASISQGLKSKAPDTRLFTGVVVDASASELIDLDDGKGPPIYAYADGTHFIARALVAERQEIADALTESFGGQKLSGHRARFQVAISDRRNLLPSIFPCLLVFVAFGCPLVYATTAVDLTIEVGGKPYRGHGEGTEWRSLFSLGGDNNFNYPRISLGRALAAALEDAGRSNGGAK